MKKYLPFILLGVFGLWVITSLRPPSPKNGFDYAEFGSLPALMNGRIQPLDSVARNSLLQIRSKATVRYPVDQNSNSQNETQAKTEKFESMSPVEWLAEVLFNPSKADERRIFVIDHPELLSLLRLGEGKQFLSFNQLKPHFAEIDRQADRAQRIEPARRTTFEKQVLKLYTGLVVFQRLKNSLYPEEYGNFTNALAELQTALAPGLEAFRASQSKKEFNQDDLNRLVMVMQKWDVVARSAYPRFIPADKNEHSSASWQSPGELVMHLVHDPNSSLPRPVQFFAAMNAAYIANSPQEFNRAISEFKSWLATGYTEEISKTNRESFFNNFAPFAKAREIYIFAFLLACFSLFNLTDWLRRSSLYLLALAFILHTAGIIFRMSIEGRPPVTNLYSSVVFVGWVVVLIGLYVEKKFPYGISVLVASIGGFATQIVAHYLSLSGDTMEVLRAVLDTNFWLATHVVTIAMGYGAVYFGGLFAVIYIILGVFTKRLTPDLARLLSRIVYGIMCFAILFSFLGTVLGGIWADQSWGRFWGWDPKENGALIIVLWTAVYLHARWGKLVSERGLMNMAVFGNIVTSWSWFGVNMLGVGLHSYGFMDTAAFWLLLFIASQIAIIGIGSIPLKYWKSFPEQAEINASAAPAKTAV
ncbi:MAG: cytochrome c biogenesis protein CcsA [Verrucomicrobiae bacterium]|nr:cytochrome c biogenesis protein CcsA [Verrucomicrobiae bacterium]